MKLSVEFLGLSRRLAQTKQAEIELPASATLRDVVRALASRFPALIGPVIVPESYDLVPAHMFNVDGRQVAADLDALAHDGQRLILMFVEAGG